MPIVRDPRNDRRRRVLRENAAQEQATTANSARRSATNQIGRGKEASPRKGAGYSQDVRQACGHRLVQLIPVRPMSFACVIAISLLIPALLSAAHYLVYVNGQLPWYGHPLARTLDANYNRSIANWVTGQLWLLCLGATVLTFQLRRHKLDDYSGEYRLWFWLVLTCIVGSLESATGIIHLFSLALDHWSTTTLGWSGPAVVKATLAVLVGMLGIRLCTELKAAPSSVVCVMLGLIAWAVSSALAQPEFQVELSQQVRIWARCTLWIGGLTCIWLAALANLRHVYIEAQERFLSRRRMLAPASSMPIAERIRSALPRFPSRDREMRDDNTESRWRFPSLRRVRDDRNPLATNEDASGQLAAKRTQAAQETRTSGESKAAARQTNQARSASATTAPDNSAGSPDEPTNGNHRGRGHHDAEPTESDQAKPRRGLGSFFKRGRGEDKRADSESNQVSRTQRNTPKTENDQQPSQATGKKGHLEEDKLEKEPSRWTRWLRKPKHSEDAEEFRKIPRSEETGSNRKQAKQTEHKQSNTANDQADAPKQRVPRRWIPRVRKPKMPKLKKPSFGWIPKVNLSALRLKPPADQPGKDDAKQEQPASKQQLPSTGGHASDATKQDEADNSRPLTKAERKRLRRMQQQNRAA